MNILQGISKSCSFAQAIDTIVAEINVALISDSLDDKKRQLNRLFLQCESCICKKTNIPNLSKWTEETHYFDHTDASFYNKDLLWIKENVIPSIEADGMCSIIAGHAIDTTLRQQGCSPELRMLFKALIGQ